MKKISLSTAALLLCLLAHSQEADSLGRYAEFTIIPRLDAGLNSPVLSKGGSNESTFNPGNSSLYTTFEGSISEHLSFTIENHWLQAGEEAIPGLYRNTGRSDNVNWLDYCVLDYNIGGFTFGVGKDMIYTGGFESQDWDYDSHPELNSTFWNAFSSYQWGARVGYSTPSGMTSFTAQMVSSPFGEHPFASRLWCWSGQWAGEYGPISNFWSVTAAQSRDEETGVKKANWLVCLGQQVELGNWTIGLDWFNRMGSFTDDPLVECADNGYWMRGHTLVGRVKFSPCEKFDIEAKYLNQAYRPEGGATCCYHDGGFVAHWFPVEGLRVHLAAACGGITDGLSLNLGVLYYFNVTNLFRKNK